MPSANQLGEELMSKLWISAGIEVQQGVDADEAAEALKTLAEETVKEPGCHKFDVLRSRENPGHFILWECWEDEAALKAHFEMPHTKSLLDRKLTAVRYIERLAENGRFIPVESS